MTVRYRSFAITKTQTRIIVVDRAVKFLNDQVNVYLMQKTGSATDKVKLTTVVDQGGTMKIADNTVGVSLINLEEERVLKSQAYVVNHNGENKKVNPEIKLNLYLLFASYSSSNYEDSLRLLSHVITFFQTKSVFNLQNSPTLDPGIERLVVDMFSIPIEQQNYLWSYVGAKYLPSVVYKVRLVKIQEFQSLEEMSEVSGVGTNLSNG